MKNSKIINDNLKNNKKSQKNNNKTNNYYLKNNKKSNIANITDNNHNSSTSVLHEGGENKSTSKSRGCIKVMAWALAGMGIISTASLIWAGIAQNSVNDYKNKIEAAYVRNFYELSDNIENAEMKLSKVLMTGGGGSYSKKLLTEVSKNASNASNNISSLPLTENKLEEVIAFVNQVDGYCTSLCGLLDSGESLTNEQLETLNEMVQCLSEIKNSINELSQKVYDGFNFTSASLKFDGDFNRLTVTIAGSIDVDYPTMIYDGPFSQSVLSPEIKGLSGDKVDEEGARATVESLISDIDGIMLLGKTNGKFVTYDFKVDTNLGGTKFVQVTETGGKVLTISGAGNNGDKTLTQQNAIAVGKQFLDKAGIENMSCVWSDTIGGYSYLNFAPIEKNIILYPDLVKMKINLSNGDVEGFEASSYYTSHTNRNLPSPLFDSEELKGKINDMLSVRSAKLCLAPLEYNREVLCYEYQCVNNGDVYYLYVNAQTGIQENILKVINTDNGNMLM